MLRLGNSKDINKTPYYYCFKVIPLGISIIIPIKEPEPYYPLLHKELEAQFKDIECEILPQYEIGLTNAIVQGVQRSKYNLIGVMDADGSHNPKDLWIMYYKAIENRYDLVIGSKMLGVDETRLTRRIISKAYGLMAKKILGITVSDPMSGMVVAKKELMTKIKPTSEYKFILQLLTRTDKIYEYPIIFRERKMGKSKTSVLLALRIINQMFKIKRESMKKV